MNVVLAAFFTYMWPMVKMTNLKDYLPENVYNIFKMLTKIGFFRDLKAKFCHKRFQKGQILKK